MRVLVVEDHPGIARGLKTFLGLRQCEVKVASDMHAALALASQNEFDGSTFCFATSIFRMGPAGS
jgi:DNA-binding response OmpR family regulator